MMKTSVDLKTSLWRHRESGNLQCAALQFLFFFKFSDVQSSFTSAEMASRPSLLVGLAGRAVRVRMRKMMMRRRMMRRMMMRRMMRKMTRKVKRRRAVMVRRKVEVMKKKLLLIVLEKEN